MRGIYKLLILSVFLPYSIQTIAQKAELIAPGMISTGMNERDITISPDGKEYYYTVVAPRNVYSVILVRKWSNNKWSEAEVAPFSGMYNDLEAAFSPDGKKIFFASSRPVDDADKPGDYNIWYVERTANGWSEAKSIGSNVNTPDGDEFYPSVTRDGTLYFTADYKTGGMGKDDIYISKFENGEYKKPVLAPEPVNSTGYEFNAWIDPDEQYIIFTGYGKKDDMGRGDLYISKRKADGSWDTPKNLGAAVNSTGIDYCPTVSPDKKYLYFTSERLIRNGDDKKRNLKEAMEKLNGAGNGVGDIYRIELAPLLAD